MAEREEELKSLLRVKKESENAGLKLNIQKTGHGISALTSWQIDGETMETVTDFIFLSSKITEDSDCSHDIKKTVASWKKSCEKPGQHIKKWKHFFADNVPSSQSYGLSSSHVQMWELDPN